MQVCDSILNIGPCANASMGEPAFLSEEVNTHLTIPTPKVIRIKLTVQKKKKKKCLFSFVQFQSNPEPDLEVVVCSGHGKNGALSVLQVNRAPL